jgi:hypothetical protein
MNTLLTIMIPTTPERRMEFDKLEFELWKQIERDGLQNDINIISDSRGKDIIIGAKRNDLYNHPDAGEYSVQWDDDDWIYHDGLKLIIEALEARPDCVTYMEHCFINHEVKASNHSLWYDDWGDNVDGYDYVRTPYMKDVIKTSIARSVQVPEIRFGEDHQWSRLLRPHLETEIHINEFIYIYQHVSSDHNTRYGIV